MKQNISKGNFQSSTKQEQPWNQATKSEKNRLHQIAQLNLRVKFEYERLLKSTVPTREKAFMLMKVLQEELPEVKRENLSRRISDFFSLSYDRRTARSFKEKLGVDCYPWLISEFRLNFSNGVISETQALKMITNLRHYFLNEIGAPSAISSPAFLSATLQSSVQPAFGSKNAGLDLSDFLEAWNSKAFSSFGDEYSYFFTSIQRVIRQLDMVKVEFKPEIGIDKNSHETNINLSQTDLHWIQNLIEKINKNEALPEYPLSTGPKVTQMVEFEKIVRAIKKHPSPQKSEAKVAVEKLKMHLLGASLSFLKLYSQDQVLYEKTRGTDSSQVENGSTGTRRLDSDHFQMNQVGGRNDSI